MRKTIRIITVTLLCSILSPAFVQAQDPNNKTISISGQVTDFNGTPIDSSVVQLLHDDFSIAYETYTDKKGNYILKNVDKGRYRAMYVIRPKEYPRRNAVPKKDMRLEYWAWNIIADRNLIINPRYHRLELYGTTVYYFKGGYPKLFVYFRPMSLTKYTSYPDSVFLNKKEAEKITDISVKPENLDIKVYADDEPLEVRSMQAVKEYEGEDIPPMLGYLIQVDAPKTKPEKPYIIIKLVGEDKEFHEKGENIYFYEMPTYR